MQKRQFKDSAYEQLARIGKAVSSPKRIELLELVLQGERTVESLANETATTVANASQHLQVLRAARLVETRREGVSIYYRAASPAVGPFMNTLRTLAEGQLAELAAVIAAFNRENGAVESVDSRTLMKRLKSGKVLLLDTRPKAEFDAGHLPGALNIPTAELPQNVKKLPKNAVIVAYCRGPYCLLAGEAVTLLQKKGFRATRLRDGVYDWAALGYSVERTPPPGEPA